MFSTRKDICLPRALRSSLSVYCSTGEVAVLTAESEGDSVKLSPLKSRLLMVNKAAGLDALYPLKLRSGKMLLININWWPSTMSKSEDSINALIATALPVLKSSSPSSWLYK